MRKLFFLALAVFMIVACNDTKKNPTEKQKVTNNDDMPDDSTIYGYCLQGSDSTCLRLLTGSQDTIEILINGEDFDEPTMVAGSFLVDDKMAVTARKIEAGWVAQRVINLTTLLGHWKSIDRDFELSENGDVNTFLTGESHRWTTWRILNGQLLLSKDTFDLVSLNVDSMELENPMALYCFMRVRKDTTHAVEEDKAREAIRAKANAMAAAKNAPKPAEVKKDTVKPTETPEKNVAPEKPAATAKPVNTGKPASTTKPTSVAKPATTSKPATTKTTTTAKPATAAKPATTSKPATTKTTTTAKPATTKTTTAKPTATANNKKTK